jgi:CheY-like chemotaxis protein
MGAAVLLVEDDADDAFFLLRELEKTGFPYEIAQALDGAEAIDRLQELRGSLRLAILDLKLPKRSGLDILHWIRQDPGLARVAVVMLTSSCEDSDRSAAANLGVAAFLRKPTDVTQLGAIAKVIRAAADAAPTA